MLFIINGYIKTMADKNIKSGVIVIKEGKIDAVGACIQLPETYNMMTAQNFMHADITKEHWVIDAKHALVMPGLIEAHCHMGITEEKKAAEGDDCNENVNPLTPELRAIDAINCMDAAFDDAIRAGITSAMIGPGSANVIGGQFAFVKTKGRKIDDLIVRAPAAMKIAFGENPKVNYGGSGTSPATRMAIAGMLRKELFLARQYLESENEKTNFYYESFRDVFEKKIPLKAHVHRVDDIFTAIRIAKEFDVLLTLDHCSEGHLIAKEIKEAGFPAIVGPHLASRNKIEVQNAAFKTAGILVDAGVLVAITTDHPVSLIQSLPLCVGLAVKSGLDMEKGFSAMTNTAAAICGVSSRVGTLEKGKDADIAIFTGNPMETFTNTLCTIINGVVVYMNIQ